MSDARDPDPGLPFAALVDGARLGIVLAAPVQGPDGRTAEFRLVYVNAAAARLLHRVREECGIRTGALVTLLSENGLLERYIDAYEHRTIVREPELHDPVTRRWYEISATRVDDFLAVSFDDVTERVEARERERLATERMAAAFERVPGAVYAIDRDWRFTYVNAEAERMFVATSEELLGTRLWERNVAVEPQAATMLRRAMDEGVPVAFEFAIAAPVHSTFSARAYPDAEGITAYVNELEPILRLEQRAAQIERSEAIATLAGGIAHDFNNLVMVIGGHASLLAAELDARSPLRQDVAAITEAARRVSELTAQLLTLSRQQVLSPVTVDLDALVRERAAAWQAAAPPGVRVDVEGDGPVLVAVDCTEVERVLEHLVANAFDAMPDGGRLVVTSSRASIESGHVADSVSGGMAEGPYGVVTVADDGTGMDSATLVRAREPFFTMKPRARSSGLGLAVAHGAARQAGGRLTIDSEPGVGTTVRLYLPASGPGTSDARGSARPAGAELPGTETVLVVDDDASVRALTVRILGDLGYHVLAAADGDEALEIASREAHAIALLVVDVVMPGRGGQQLAGEIQARIGPVPVLYVSGYAENTTITPTDPAAATAFLGKPYGRKELANRVRQILDDSTSIPRPDRPM